VARVPVHSVEHNVTTLRVILYIHLVSYNRVFLCRKYRGVKSGIEKEQIGIM
jgi:hypothetical protein